MSRELTYLYSPSYFCSIIVILPIGLLKRVRKNPEIIKYAIMLAGPCEYQEQKLRWSRMTVSVSKMPRKHESLNSHLLCAYIANSTTFAIPIMSPSFVL